MLLISWVAVQRSPVSPKAARFLVSPPKGYYLEAAGVRQSFALSPDGERIAFTAKDTSGAFGVFLRDFSEPESRPVADSKGAYSVVWSPDGQSLLFTSNGKVRRVWCQRVREPSRLGLWPVLFLGDPLRVRPLARVEPRGLLA